LCYDAFNVSMPSPRKLPYGNAGMRRRWIGTILTLNLCASAISADPALRGGAPWPDTLLARVEALALIETLNASLLGAHTATSVLDKWCSDHKLASDPAVRAKLVTGMDKPVSTEQRQRLHIDATEKVVFRHVELTCGGHVLVEADNWYVPGRLGAEINHILAMTDTPFGRAVQDLNPVRENFSVEILWKPLHDGWELAPPPPEKPAAALAIPWQLFQHRALVYNGAHEPFSEVSEIYTREVLAFGPP
jgi:hypothetical protein